IQMLPMLVVVCLIPTVLSHAIPTGDKQQLQWISKTEALHTLETAVRNDKINCVVCSTIVQGIRQLIEEEQVEEEIDEFLNKACVTLDLAAPYICEALINEYAVEIYFVLERVIFTPDELCGIFVD
ncbi:hypothetical protein PMAYCL1PPCAC_01897, partial [Pristionchus mayeri]